MATLLALMLFVSFLATFVFGELPSQMGTQEFLHQSQVEDQLGRLQDSVIEAANALNGNGSSYLSNPVTLNSGGVPPFGTPSTGSIVVEPTYVGATAAFGVSNVTAANVGWGHGSSCFSTGSGTCTTGSGTEVYNFSGNKSTVSPTIAGCAAAGCSVVFNVTGNSNALTVTLTGAAIKTVLVQVSGNWDNLTLSDGGTCNLHQSVAVVFSGNNDSYTLTMTGCTTGLGANLNTTFVGSSGSLCPYGNAASSDTWKGATWGSSTGIFQNLTWQNAFGITSPENSIPANGGHNHVTFSNQSGYFQCLFTTAQTSGPYTLHFLSGVRVQLNNRYTPVTSVAYDQGAVILGQQNGGSIMIDPPQSSYVQQPFGVSYAITLVSLVGSTGAASGLGTVAVVSSILSEQTYNIIDGRHSNTYLPYIYLNFTTAFPQAWATYFSHQTVIDPAGVTCTPGPGGTVANCLTPQNNGLSTISVPINASEFTLNIIVAQVSIG